MERGQDTTAKEQIIKKFFREKTFAAQDLLKLVEKFSDLATITETGEVNIRCKCRSKDRVAIVAIARFLAQQLKDETQIEVKAEVTAEEVSKFADMDKGTATARLKELVDAGLLTRVRRGVFRVKSMSQAEKWINTLYEEYIEGGRMG